MPLVTFKDLCIDAKDVDPMARFWSTALHLGVEPLDGGEALLRGSDESRSVWINRVPEVRTVKNRVHLDLVAPSLEPFADLEQRSAPGEFPWTVFADPEGNELCVFVKADRAPGLKDVVVDSVAPPMIAAWWAGVWGGSIGHDPDDDSSWIDDVPGAPVESFDFVPVPEPKTVKNRLHWDVTLTEGSTIADLVAAGATIFADQPGHDRWTVMADPEGNEFCVFAMAE